MAKTGRPKKYDKEYLDALALHLEEKAEYYLESQLMFFLSEVALKLGFLKDYFDDFSEKNENFALALKKLKSVQEINFGKNLIKRESNTGGIIFAMKNCCGWRDAKQIEVTDKKILLDE